MRGRSSPLEVAIEKKTTGRFLALELVDGADARVAAGERGAQGANLGVVGRDDEDVVPAEAVLAAVAVDVGAADQARDLGRDRGGLLG